MKKIIIASLAVILFNCASQIPMNSSLNDFVMMGLKTNSKDAVTPKFISEVTDSAFFAWYQGAPEFYFTEKTTFGIMLNEYFQNRFMKFGQSPGIELTVTLKEFQIKSEVINSTGQQVMTALVGGTTDNVIRAKMKTIISFQKDGQDYNKIILSSAETQYSTSSNGTASGNISFILGKLINETNNKTIMNLNAFLTECGL